MSAPLTRLADFMPYRLSVTSNAVSTVIAGEYRSRFGLKVPEWRVMAILGDTGSATQRELVAATKMDKVAVNRACKVLEHRGLVARSPNARDGRSHHIELTVRGHAMHEEIMPLALDMEQRIFAPLATREREQLRVILGKLLASVAALESREGEGG
ncbi:MAG: MarR family winged helix-turn-helix transcriptional regulator [Novosphingobium sp.]